MAYQAAVAVDRLSLPRRAGRPLARWLLHEFHGHRRRLEAGGDRGCRRLERRDSHRGPGPQLPGSARGLDVVLRRRPRRASGAPRRGQRVPRAAVAVGDRQLPMRLAAARSGCPEGSSAVAGDRPSPELRRAGPDARPARLLPGPAGGPGQPRHPARLGAPPPGHQPDQPGAVRRIHSRPGAPGAALVARVAQPALPGDRRGHVSDDLARAHPLGASGRRVQKDPQIPD